MKLFMILIFPLLEMLIFAKEGVHSNVQLILFLFNSFIANKKIYQESKQQRNDVITIK